MTNDQRESILQLINDIDNEILYWKSERENMVQQLNSGQPLVVGDPISEDEWHAHTV